MDAERENHLKIIWFQMELLPLSKIFNFPIKGCLQALKRAPNPVAKLTSQHLRLSKTGNGRGGGWVVGNEVTTQIMAPDGEQIWVPGQSMSRSRSHMSPPPLLWRQHPQLGNLFCRWQAVSTFGVQGEFMRTAPSSHFQCLTDVRFAFVFWNISDDYWTIKM